MEAAPLGVGAVVPKPAIVFLMRRPVTEWHREAWGFAHLLDAGLEIRALDLRPVLEPVDDIGGVTAPGGPEQVTVVRSAKQLDALIAELAPSSVFVDGVIGLSDVDAKSLPLFRSLKRHNAVFYIVAGGELPLPSHAPSPERQRELFKRRLKQSLNPFKLADYVARKSIIQLTRRFDVSPLPKRIFGPSSETLRRYVARLQFPQAGLMPGNATDYDRYIDLVNSGSVAQGGASDGTIVFLDQAMTHHPDFETLGLELPDEATYYDRMRRFFDQLEADTGWRVIISAHHLSTYEPHDAAFGGREIVYGKTPKLVSRCEAVVVHASTAINFAVLFGKPLLFVVTDDIIAVDYLLDCQALADALDLPVRNVDQWSPKRAQDDYLAVPKEAYERYERNYLVSEGSRGRSTWEIVAETALTDIASRS